MPTESHSQSRPRARVVRWFFYWFWILQIGNAVSLNFVVGVDVVDGYRLVFGEKAKQPHPTVSRRRRFLWIRIEE